jgi:hypothetical protein
VFLNSEGEFYASPRLPAWKKLSVTIEQAVGRTPSTELAVHRVNTNVPNSAGAGSPIFRSVDSYCNDGAIPDSKYLLSPTNNCLCVWIRNNGQINTRKVVIRIEMFAQNLTESASNFRR